nr:dynamin family protein [Kineosporia babensis]
MRVAVAGEIKRGKSTLVNALIGAEGGLTVADAEAEAAMATGQLETTYVLTEIVHGSRPSLRVLRKDGTAEDVSLTRLREFTARRADASLDDVERVVVTLPAPLLSRFRLIDTPGFNSVYGTDAQNALSILTGDEVRAADAVVYAIANEGLSQVSEQVARQFSTGGDDSAPLTPMKAIGVVPRANEHWFGLLRDRRRDPTVDTDPFVLARREIETTMRGPGRGLFHAIVPVNALLGEAAALATDEDFAAIAELTGVEDDLLLESFAQMPHQSRAFAARTDFPLEPDRRQRLITTFSSWGLWRAIVQSRAKPPIDELRAELDRISGVAALRDLVHNHFGARAGAIRVSGALAQITAANRRIRLHQPPGSQELAVCEDIGRRLEDVMLAHSVLFAQIDVLGKVYQGLVRFSPAQREDLLRLTGERGMGLPERLGLEPGASPAELRQAAVTAAARWATAAATLTGSARLAARDLQRSLDTLLAQIDTPERP